MPAALAILAEDTRARTDVEDVENVRLGLPSDINDGHRARVCATRLQDIKSRLREAQCRDALQDLRNKLHTIAHLYKYRKAHVRHQGANTRARADVAKQDARKDRAAATYRRAYGAKLALSGPGDWQRTLKPLQDQDIRHMTEDEPALVSKKRKAPDGVGEGRRKVSWIWQGADASGQEGATDSLRVEWFKMRARAMRWGEELKLLPEEMRRCLATLVFEEEVWLTRTTTRPDTRLRPRSSPRLTLYARNVPCRVHGCSTEGGHRGLGSRMDCSWRGLCRSYRRS